MSPGTWTYEIAGRRLASDARLPELQSFAGQADRRARVAVTTTIGSPSSGTDLPPAKPQQVFRGPAEIGRYRRFLRCSWGNPGYELSVAGLGRFEIAPRGERILFHPAAGTPGNPTELTEMVLGPSLTLALALQGVFCLHASAVVRDGAALAFLGDSGAGKSTLARVLPQLASGESGGTYTSQPRGAKGTCVCAADDLLPVTLNAGQAVALPRFPQLKYRPDRQPGAGVPPSLPLAAIYLLDPQPTTVGEVATLPLTGTAAVLALVRHTHSGCLFSRQLLRHHIDFCARLASQVPIGRLTYPKTWTSLPRIEAALRRPASRPAAPGEQ